MSIDSGVRNPVPTPPLADRVPVLDRFMSFLRSTAWSTWFTTKLLPQFRQINVVGNIDFPNTAAQSSSAELTIVFTIGDTNGRLSIPVDTYILCVRVLDPATDLPVALPAGCFFTYRFFQDNNVAIRFNNFSAGAVDPPEYKFDILFQLRVT